MLIAVDPASPAVLLVASEWVMCKVLHADLFYLWKIPLHINLCGGIHFLLAVVYWFVVGSGSITQGKGFSVRSFEEEWCSQVVHWGGGVCPPGGTASSGSVSLTALNMQLLPAVTGSKSVHQIFTARGRKCGELARGWMKCIYVKIFSAQRFFILFSAQISNKFCCCCSQSLEDISHMAEK